MQARFLQPRLAASLVSCSANWSQSILTQYTNIHHFNSHFPKCAPSDHQLWTNAI